MSARRMLMSLFCVLALTASAAPAHAGTWEKEKAGCGGVGQPLVGCIVSRWVWRPVFGLGDFYEVNNTCAFEGVLTPNGTLIVSVQGTANAETNDATRIPQLTYINCEIHNASGESTSTGLLLNGPASATASSTLLDNSGPKEWPVQPITVCTSAFALFGNSSPVRVDSDRQCDGP